MAKQNYADLYNPTATPQTEKARDDQVMNNAGGAVFALDKWKRLERFLVLGADSSTYYQKAPALTRENAKVVEQCWAEDPLRTAQFISTISTEGRAPKNDPAIFALALGSISANPVARAWALNCVGQVCRTGTHLFQFVSLSMKLGKGFGRGMKRAVGNWYTSKSVDDLAYQVVKYRSREGLTHENLLDLAHPKSGSDEMRSALHSWIIGKLPIDGEVARPHGFSPLVIAHERAMQATKAAELLPIIADHPRIPWEALPTWANADPAVQKALIPAMGLTALVRNLGNLTRIGAIKPMSDEEATIVARLGDEQALRKSRVHPMAVLTALMTYASGRGVKGGGEWTANQKIVAALDRAFYLAFQNVVPSGKRHVIGVDVSGSMSSPVSGSAVLSCCTAAAAMAMVIDRTEPKTFVGRFNQGFEPVPIASCRRLDDVLEYTQSINGGGTDCAMPMLYALKHKIEADVFIVVTDNETWAGTIHPFQALEKYRQETGIAAKLVVIAMTPTNFSIADPNDAFMLDVAGFDAGVPALVADFARG